MGFQSASLTDTEQDNLLVQGHSASEDELDRFLDHHILGCKRKKPPLCLNLSKTFKISCIRSLRQEIQQFLSKFLVNSLKSSSPQTVQAPDKQWQWY